MSALSGVPRIPGDGHDDKYGGSQEIPGEVGKGGRLVHGKNFIIFCVGIWIKVSRDTLHNTKVIDILVAGCHSRVAEKKKLSGNGVFTNHFCPMECICCNFRQNTTNVCVFMFLANFPPRRNIFSGFGCS